MINFCKAGYCLNGGTCVSSVTGPHCVCDEVFFTGAYCHIPIARCDLTPSPCKNNGTCSGGIGIYNKSAQPTIHPPVTPHSFIIFISRVFSLYI